MSEHPFASLVTTAWLAENLQDPNVKSVDGSWYLPADNRDGAQEFRQAHIPSAVFFDFNAIADTTNPLPHMFPSAQQFGEDVGALGISNADHVITYAGNQMAACRVWWMFKAFGHDRVSVLDGGFTKWHGEGRPISDRASEIEAATFSANYNEAMIRDVEDITGLVARQDAGEQILDARSAGRFDGSEPEPRAGMRSGHMPGAFNLPYTRLVNADHSFKEPADLAAEVANSGIDPNRPIVTTCGSGVSAAVLLFGLGRIGRQDTALYDGSWSEWGARADTAIVTA